MNRNRFVRTPFAPRILLASFWAMVCIAIIAAPMLEAHGHFLASALLYECFAPVCHQNPSRSFFLFGYKWAVCHRCSGIYFGLFVASLLPCDMTAFVSQPCWRRVWIFCATMPLLLDVFLPFTGLWHNTPASRLATGWLFGAMLSSLLTPALAELIQAAQRRRSRHNADAVGGLS